MRAWALCTASSCDSSLAVSREHSAIADSRSLRLAPRRCETLSTAAKAGLDPRPARSRCMIAVSWRFFSAIADAISAWSAAVLVLTNRAAAAEISPEVAESRSASVITGTSWPATRSTPRSVAEKETIATAAAMTVSTATAPNANWSFALTPNRRAPIGFALSPAVITRVPPTPPARRPAAHGHCLLAPPARSGALRRRLQRQPVDRLERPVRLNHRQEDLVEALVLLRSEGHRQAADVELAGVLDDLDEARAGRRRAGLVERRDGEPADQITLERDEFRRRLDRRLVVGDDLERGVPRERHDLGDHDALAVRPQLLGERRGADERDVEEDRIELGLARELDELGARLVGADHRHRLGLGALEGEQRRFHRDRVALEGPLGGEFHAAPLQRRLDAVEAGATERVVLIEDGDLLDLEVFGEVLDPGLGLGGVARADIDDVLELGIAQEAGAGERTGERHPGGAGDRHRRVRGGRSDGADQREHPLLLDQLLGRDDRAVGLIPVVDAHQLELAAVDAAPGVDFLERRQDAGAHALPERRGGPFEHGRLAEQDGIGGDAVIGRRRGRRHECKRACRQHGRAPKRLEHDDLPGEFRPLRQCWGEVKKPFNVRCFTYDCAAAPPRAAPGRAKAPRLAASRRLRYQPRHARTAGPANVSKDAKHNRLKARLPRGLSDRGPAEIAATRRMLETIRAVYERYGFEPVETPAIEYTDALGKFLPDQDRPNEGVFSFQDGDEQWLSLRYDLTAPLARYVAENFDALPKPYRSYRFGWVFRNEKPGPGRFRQFMQFDADTVGSASPAADAEMCMMAVDTIEALGIPRGSYVVKVNNRKVLDGVMEAIGLGGEANAERRVIVFRAIDKFDRLGIAGVRQLLGGGRRDESGDFTKGAGLDAASIETIVSIFESVQDPEDKIAQIDLHLKDSEVGQEGRKELEQIASLIAASGYDDGRVAI